MLTWQDSNLRPCGSMVGTLDIVFGGPWVRFLPVVRKFLFSQGSVVSPPSKLKMFTGSVCVLLISVSLKLIKIKITLIYATMSLWEKNQMAVERSVMPADFIFLFMIQVDPSPILSYFYFFIRSELIQVDLDWRSELIRSDFCTCLIQKHICSWWTLKMSRTYDLLILILKQTKRKKASTKDCSIKSREWHLRRTCCWLQCKSKTHDSQHVYSFRNLSSF